MRIWECALKTRASYLERGIPLNKLELFLIAVELFMILCKSLENSVNIDNNNNKNIAQRHRPTTYVFHICSFSEGSTDSYQSGLVIANHSSLKLNMDPSTTNSPVLPNSASCPGKTAAGGEHAVSRGQAWSPASWELPAEPCQCSGAQQDASRASGLGCKAGQEGYSRCRWHTHSLPESQHSGWSPRGSHRSCTQPSHQQMLPKAEEDSPVYCQPLVGFPSTRQSGKSRGINWESTYYWLIET